ncbi:MAG: zinc-ribbon domain-containing protein [Anaeromyxobacter sp.]
MIVICTRCEAKFRVADERVGPRGAKVRCSRCQQVFLVHRDIGTISEPSPAGAPDPFAPAGEPGPDPFAGPPATPAPRADDPFGQAAWGAPFVATPMPAQPRPPTALVEPPAATSPHRSATSALPLTDLSALLGDPAPRPAAPDPFSPPAAPPAAPPRPAAQAQDPFAAAPPAPRPAAPPPDPFAAAPSRPAAPRPPAPQPPPRQAAPPPAVATPPPLPRPAPTPDPFAARPAPAPAAAPPPLPLDPFGALPPAAPQRPAAAPPPGPAAAPDPFTARPAATAPEPAAEDPFASGPAPAAAAVDPFGTPVPSAPAPAAAAAEPDPFAAGADPFLVGPDPFDAGSEPFDGAAGPASSGPGADLDIEDRSGSRPQRSPAEGAPLPTPATPESLAFEAAFQPAIPAPPSDGTLSLASEATPSLATPVAPAPAPEPAPRKKPQARPTPAPVVTGSAALQPERGPLRGVRGAAVNALSLVALLVLALAFRLVWRGEVALADAFRPSALVAALRGRPPVEPFTLRDVAAAVYPQAGGGGLLYVRGDLQPRPGTPAGPLRVHVELVRDGRVLAAADGLAGVVPSPEELYAAVDRAALDQLAGALQARPPAAGPWLPFLVPVPDAPRDLTGASVRVEVTPAAGGAGP